MLPGLFQPLLQDPANIYLFKVNNSNIRKRCGICSKKNNKDRRRSCVFIVNFEQISHLLSSVSIVDFEQKNDLWVCVFIKILLKYCPLAWKNWSQKPWNQDYYTKLWLESVLISIHGFEQNKIFQFFGSRFFFVFRGPFVFFIPGDIQAFQILVQKIFFTHAALELHVQSKDYFKVRITCSKLFSCIYQKLLIKTAEWRQ